MPFAEPRWGSSNEADILEEEDEEEDGEDKDGLGLNGSKC